MHSNQLFHDTLLFNNMKDTNTSLKPTPNISNFLTVSLMLCGGCLILTRALIVNVWFDEAFSVLTANLPVSKVIEVVAHDTNPPLYYLVLHFWLQFGTGDFWIRIPSIVAIAASVMLLYLVTKSLNKGATANWGVVAFFLSPSTIYLASTARLHAFALFLVLLSTYFYIQLLDNSKNTRVIGAFILSFTAALYTQYYTLLFIPVYLAYFFVRKNTLHFKKLVSILMVPLALFLPWLFYISTLPHNGCACPNSLFTLPATILSPVIAGIGEVSLRRYVLDITPPVLTFYAFETLFFLFVFFLGLKKNIYTGIFYILPLFILTVLGFFWQIFSNKGASILLPFFFIICAQYIFLDQIRKFIPILLLIFLLITSSMQVISPFYYGISYQEILRFTSVDRAGSIAHTSPLTYLPGRYYQPHLNHILLHKAPFIDSVMKLLVPNYSENQKNTDVGWIVDVYEDLDENSKKRREDTFTQYTLEHIFTRDRLSLYKAK